MINCSVQVNAPRPSFNLTHAYAHASATGLSPWHDLPTRHSTQLRRLSCCAAHRSFKVATILPHVGSCHSIKHACAACAWQRAWTLADCSCAGRL